MASDPRARASREVLRPGSRRASILSRLHEITEELIEAHAQLALLLNAEKEGRVASFATYVHNPEFGKDSVSARDRTADAATLDLSTDIIELRHDMAGLIDEREFLTLLLSHTIE